MKPMEGYDQSQQLHLGKERAPGGSGCQPCPSTQLAILRGMSGVNLRKDCLLSKARGPDRPSQQQLQLCCASIALPGDSPGGVGCRHGAQAPANAL